MPDYPLISRPESKESTVEKQWSGMIEFLRKKDVSSHTLNNYQHLALVGRGKLRFDEHLGQYFTENYRLLGKGRGVGTIKSEWYAENFRLIARHLGWSVTAPTMELSHAESLRMAGVPDNYPVAACFFSESHPDRVVSGAAKLGIMTLVELCERALTDVTLSQQRGDSGGLRPQRIFGRESKEALGEFWEAVKMNDRERVRKVVPIFSDGSGVDLGLLVAKFFSKSPTIRPSDMRNRLVHGNTLQEVADGLELERDNVRQSQVKLVALLKAVLDGIPTLREVLLKQWTVAGSLKVRSNSDFLVADIAAAATGKLFDEDPYNAAMKQQFDEACQEIVDALRILPDYHFGCLDIRTYLQKHGRVSLDYLLRWNSDLRSRNFDYEPTLDHVKPRKPDEKRVVAALILAGTRSAHDIFRQLQRVQRLKMRVTSIEQLRDKIVIWRKQDATFPQADLNYSVEAVAFSSAENPTGSGGPSTDGAKGSSRTVFLPYRDAELARRVKVENDFRCQICNCKIELPAGQGAYAESHHIIPLGQAHNGRDERSNMICVCPHHHVLLDFGVIALDKTQLMGRSEAIADAAVKYHNNQIFGKRRKGILIDREVAILTPETTPPDE